MWTDIQAANKKTVLEKTFVGYDNQNQEQFSEGSAKPKVVSNGRVKKFEDNFQYKNRVKVIVPQLKTLNTEI